MKTLIAFFLGLALTAGAAGAFEIGEDGLHKEKWMSVTFKDMTEDLKAASDAGKRLRISVSTGCPVDND